MRNELHSLISIAQALDTLRHCREFDSTSPSHLMLGLEKRGGWRRMPEWEEYSDSEIYEKLDVGVPDGSVFVITDISYREGLGAFVLAGSQVSEFVSTFRNLFGERLFGGEVLMISDRTCTVWAFHHEGAHGAFGAAEGGPRA